MKTINRFDTMVWVQAYLCLLSLGGAAGGMLVFVTIIPTVQAMGLDGASVMAIPGTLSLFIAGWAGLALWGLGKGTSHGYSLTLILTTLMALVSGLSLPILLLVGLQGIALNVPLATTAALFIASGCALWVLKQSPNHIVVK
jgi:hypothetical protein